MVTPAEVDFQDGFLVKNDIAKEVIMCKMHKAVLTKM